MRIAVFISILFLFFSCAKRGNPTGGPKDELAPILIQANPPHNSIQFNEKEIVIQFDEYIKLKDVQKQLVVSPPLKYKPIITPLGLPSKRITIKIKDTLKQNSTYVFNFGNSIEDNNEGNVISNFKYVLSTGNQIDSLSVKGIIRDAFKEKTEDDIFIQLYDSKSYYDSIIYKEKPLYITNSLDTTSWSISNLKEGKYRVIALKDNNRDNLYQPKDDKIGFLNREINIPLDTVISLDLFKEISTFKMVKPKEVAKGHLLFGFYGDKDGVKIELENEKSNKDFISNQYLDEKTDSIHYFYKGIDADSLKFKITRKDYEESFNVKLRLKLKDSLNVNLASNNILHPEDTLSFKTNIPMDVLDADKFSIIDKDTVAVPFKLNKVKEKLKVIFSREVDQRYTLKILPNGIQDFYGQTTDTLKYNFSTKKKDYYGSITFDVKTKNEQLIIELLDPRNKIVKRQFCVDSKQTIFENLAPNTYRVRVINDVNKNKKWDTGNYLNSIQPESVYYLNKEIKLQSNWFIKENIKL